MFKKTAWLLAIGLITLLSLVKLASAANTVFLSDPYLGNASNPSVKINFYPSGFISSSTYSGYSLTAGTATNAGSASTASTVTGLVQAIGVGTNYITGGNLGIGTTAPTLSLDTTGSIRVRSTAVAAGNIRFDASNPYITASSWIGMPGGLYVSGGTAYFQNQMQARGGIHNDSAAYLTIAGGTGGNTYFNGNIGIGTTAPAGNLDVASANTSGGYWLDGKAALTGETVDNWLRINNGGTWANGIYTPGNLRVDGELRQGSVDAGAYGIQTNAAFYSAGASILAATSGSVGIGTTAPGELLSLGAVGKLGVLSFAGSTSGKVIVQPAVAAGTWTMTLPTTAGTSGYFLQTNGSGVTTWAAAGGGSQTPWTSAINAAGYALNGNSTASGKLTLDSTSHATKGYVLINPTGGNVGIGTTAPASYKLEIAGNVGATGFYSVSDARYKINVRPLANILNKIENIDGVTFEWDQAKFPAKNFSAGRQIGFIAQDVEQEFPELVMTGADGYKTIMYEKFSSVLLSAVKEQQAEIKNLQLRVEELEDAVNNKTK